jgi:hypothetical protein
MVSYTPFQIFDIASFHDSRNQEVLEEPLDALYPSCYNRGDDVIENIDEFIHVERHKWNVICSIRNGDPIYDIEGHFQLFPLEQPCMIDNDLNIWKHEDDMITYLFRSPKDELLNHSHDDPWSYPRGFETYSFGH